MSLELRSIIGQGDLKAERLTFKVTSNLDVGDYILLRVPLWDGNLMTEVEDAFWFPFELVDKGDLVVVYTKPGSTRKRDLENGRKAHFFYWGKSEPLWSESDYSAVIANAPDWSARSVKELAKAN